MKVFLVTGGARAGKSRWAEEEALRLGGRDVTYIATARAGDDEMARRIAVHREARPEGWITVETQVAVPPAVAAAPSGVVLLDCLTLWVSNLMLSGNGVGLDVRRDVPPPAETGPGRSAANGEERIEAGVEQLLDTARGRGGTLLIVTNEVGLGLVPDNPLGRRYRDLLGWANARIAREAQGVVLMVAGIAVRVR